MAAIILSRAEYLVVLDILQTNRIFGLDGYSLFPVDRETQLALIHQGIRQLESRGLVKIKRGRHIIERRLLEVVSVVARPQVVITTIRDRAGIGAQLYLHYQAGGDVVEQMLPDEDHFSLGQLPDTASAMDRILRLLNLPYSPSEQPQTRAITREVFDQISGQLESGESVAALSNLIRAGWPDTYAREYLATQAHQQMSGLVSVMAPRSGQPGASRDLILIHNNEMAWLVSAQPGDQSQLLVRQVNAASFRTALEEAYSAISGQSQVQP